MSYMAPHFHHFQINLKWYFSLSMFIHLAKDYPAKEAIIGSFNVFGINYKHN